MHIFNYLHISLKALNSAQQTAKKVEIINAYIVWLLEH